MSSKLRVAYLGPEGTYTQEAALTKFGTYATYIPYDTITHTLQAVHTDEVEAACIPLENSLHGSVIETLDLLREDWVGGEGGVKIRGECTIGIEHCLVARRGVGMGDIRRVLSHEQALGQCHDFLSTYLPTATQVRTTSTAAAAQQLLSSTDPVALQSAAICSRVCADVHNELYILQAGIQDGESANSLPQEVQVPIIERALLRFVPPARIPADMELGQVSLSSAVRSLPRDVLVMRVDRRPSLAGEPFHDCTFLEVAGRPSGVVGLAWEERVKRAVKAVNDELSSDSTPYCSFLGTW